MPESADTTRAHYFVDEAGDLTLFDKRGRIVVGREGVSRTFVVGAGLLPNVDLVEQRLLELRVSILRDPYFKGIPSMQPGAGKTARSFHAKDDVPEVRMQVFRLIAETDVQMFVAFRRKDRLARQYAEHFRSTGMKISVDSVYDGLVGKVFHERLHQAQENHIVFARRGKSHRTVALS